jgi:peptidoglycan/LPS O-acetylase OafA/YrhL
MYYTGRYCEGALQKILLLTTAVVISILFAWVFAKVIEGPSMRWSQMIKYKRKEVLPPPHESP